MPNLIWPAHVATLEGAVDADGVALDPTVYRPAPGGGFDLDPALNAAQDEREARLAAQDAEMARLQARIEALAVRRALGEELRAAGVRPEMVRGAVALLTSAWRFVVGAEPDDDARLPVHVDTSFGAQPIEHAVQAWAVSAEGKPFLSAAAAGALARSPAPGAYLLH